MAKNSKGEMPESLRTFEAAARSGGVKPADQGLTAKPDTKALADSNQRKADKATAILHAGATNDPAAARKAIKSKPDPRDPK